MEEPPTWGEQSPCAAPPGILSSKFSRRIALFKRTATASFKGRKGRWSTNKSRNSTVPSSEGTRRFPVPRTPRSFTWPVGASASSDCQQPLFLSILPQSQRGLSPTIKRTHFGLSLSTFQQIVLGLFRNGVSPDQNYFSTRKYTQGKTCS